MRENLDMVGIFDGITKGASSCASYFILMFLFIGWEPIAGIFTTQKWQDGGSNLVA